MQIGQILLLLTLASTAFGGNILFLPAAFSPSHRSGMLPWADTLTERGHNVMFWSWSVLPDKYVPQKTRSKMMTVSIDDHWRNEMFVYQNYSFFFDDIWRSEKTIPAAESIMAALSTPFCEELLTSRRQEIDELLKTKWDVIIMDELFNPCGWMLAQWTTASIGVFVSTIHMTRHAAYRNAQPIPLSYVPTFGTQSELPDRMNIVQRLRNLYYYWAGHLVDFISFSYINNRLKRFYPELTDVTKSLTHPDLVFAYYPVILDFPNPLLSNIVHVGGMHIHPKESLSLPAPFAEWVESSKGFIVVAMGHFGSKLQHALPHQREAFVKAFNKLATENGLTVFWQHNGPPLELEYKLSPNVRPVNWLPQSALIAHPRCKVFVSHSGCNSALEAITYGVPIVSLPLFADQHGSAQILVQLGAAVRLNKLKLTPESIYETVVHAMTNKSIGETSRKLSSMMEKQPELIGKAVFWTEFLLRQKNSKAWSKFRVPTDLLSYFKYFCIDVILVGLVIISVAVYILSILAMIIWRQLNKK